VAGPTAQTTVRRLPERGRYDRETIHAILDEALVCHVGFVDAGQPFVIPSAFARVGERIVIHGSAASRMLKTLAAGESVCVTVTLLDGLVLARSAFHHSMNYRSVVVVGTASEIEDPDGKRRALDAIVEHIAPGQLGYVRPPSELELRATRVVSLPLDEASAKLRTGPPKDDEEDYALEVWAGELPLRLVPQQPVADPRLREGIRVPSHVVGSRRGRQPG
jgi:nitroimidazol reductase NimA-like FMN-containing flavoprotein (pyridoxamine 5'-phosphate oxidase superfamily)